jgi:hypothetical protein
VRRACPVLEVELLAVAVDALELDEAGQELGLDVGRAEASRADEARRRGADALDRLRAV